MTIHIKPAADAGHQVIQPRSTARAYQNLPKRCLDIAFVLMVAPFIVPVIVIVALAVATDGGSPFFIQRRVGKDGRVFSMIKLRSMVVDAEARLRQHLAANSDAKKEWDEKQKLCPDPRITRVGRIIRKTSIDELPQFFNVLIGDMSVVGPRPMMPSQRELYPGKAYFALKPGITGFWQIGDRHATSFADRARYDADYYREMSFMTDVRVIFRTVRVVLTGTGA